MDIYGFKFTFIFQLFMRFLLLLFILFFKISFALTYQENLKEKSLKEILALFFKQETDVKTMQNCAEELLRRGKKNNNYNDTAYGYFFLERMNIGEKALSYNDSVYKYFSKTNNNDFLMSTLLDRANILNFDLNKKIDALNLYLEVYNNYNNNDDFLRIDALQKIATIKSEDLGEFQESIKLFKKIAQYYKENLNNQKFDGKEKYYWSLFTIASNYKDLHKLDSATYYNKLGYQLTKINNYECNNGLFILNQAAVETDKNNFYRSIDSINNVIPILKKCKLKGNLAAAYFYKAKNYQGLKKTILAVENYKIVDSLFSDSKILNPKFLGGYKYLINYYKNKNDLKNQLLFINKYLSIDSILQNKNNNYRDILKDKYEIPQLLFEKQKIIISLNKKSLSLKLYLIISISLILFLILILFYQYKKQILNKKRFNKIIEDLNIDKKNINTKENDLDEKNRIIGMPIEVFDNIAEKLTLFEKQTKYIETSLTLEKLSSIFETNSKYLSKVVNIKYQKTFPNYLNELRINYIIKELNTNKTLRNYTINAISKEAGFNNADSFSAAFSKITGMKPSFFIKELNKIKNKNN